MTTEPAPKPFAKITALVTDTCYKPNTAGSAKSTLFVQAGAAVFRLASANLHAHDHADIMQLGRDLAECAICRCLRDRCMPHTPFEAEPYGLLVELMQV